eukprot:7999284-Pyramimonas_sp.AAC.1
MTSDALGGPAKGTSSRDGNDMSVLSGACSVPWSKGSVELAFLRSMFPRCMEHPFGFPRRGSRKRARRKPGGDYQRLVLVVRYRECHAGFSAGHSSLEERCVQA